MDIDTLQHITPDLIDKVRAARSLEGVPVSEAPRRFKNIGEVLFHRAIFSADSNFLTFHDDNGRAGAWTYREFLDRVLKVARLLTETLHIRPGDRIATLMTNDPRMVMIYFGAWAVGATVVPVNTGEDDDRTAFILQNSEAKAVFAGETQLQRCAALRGQTPGVASWVQVGGAPAEGFLDFDAALERQTSARHAPLPDVPPDTECLVVYTSGTTGAPKGVALEQVNLLVDAESIAAWHGFGPEDRAMCVLPIHHVNGTVVTLMTPLFSGGSVVLNNRLRAKDFWRTLAEERCTWVSVVPTVLAFLCEVGEDLAAHDLSRFRHFICGAGPLTVEMARRFDEQFGKRVVHGYGLSETTCYSCFLPIDLEPDAYRHWMQECGFPSIGCPVPANEMAIHDPDGNPLPPDSRGEIVIRGHNVMRWYFKRPDANADAFKNGWFRSGDEGFFRRGEDGRDYYFITGRLKELIIRGGVNYSPFDIDEVINAIPGVKAGMAVGFENDFYGEEIGAYVQKEEGAALTAEEVLAACRKSLPYAKCPKVALFGETFPVTSTGKYQRNKLKPLFAEWKAVQFREQKPSPA